MSYVFFKKELVSNSLKLPDGSGYVPFEVLGSNTGVLKLNSETQMPLISALRKVAGSRGVVEINELAYENLKKNRPYSPSGQTSSAGMPQLRVLRRDPPQPKKDASPAAVAEPKVEPAKPLPVVADAEVSPEPPVKRKPGRPARIGVPKPPEPEPVTA